MIEQTLVLLKPDCIVRQISGKVISRFEDTGLKIVGMKMIWADDETAKKHYREDIAQRHGERVRNSLLEFLREGPVIAMVLEGPKAIETTRKITGATYPHESPPGTIRGDFAHISKEYANAREIHVKNLVHASANAEDAKIEIPIWFKKNELHTYRTVHDIICLKL